MQIAQKHPAIIDRPKSVTIDVTNIMPLCTMYKLEQKNHFRYSGRFYQIDTRFTPLNEIRYNTEPNDSRGTQT
ncbi:hypothetical protein Hanom_Chr11g01009621 [Helianthus anomalus]